MGDAALQKVKVFTGFEPCRKHDVRLNTWLAEEASWALTRLARHWGESMKAVLENLLIGADRETESKLADDEMDTYYRGVQ